MSSTIAAPTALNLLFGNFTKSRLLSVQFIIENERELQVSLFRTPTAESESFPTLSSRFFSLSSETILLSPEPTGLPPSSLLSFLRPTISSLTDYPEVPSHVLTSFHYAHLTVSLSCVGLLYWIAMEVLFLTQAIDRVVTICSGMLLLIIIVYPFQLYALSTLVGYRDHWQSLDI